jgi:hypothetical protein
MVIILMCAIPLCNNNRSLKAIQHNISLRYIYIIRYTIHVSAQIVPSSGVTNNEPCNTDRCYIMSFFLAYFGTNSLFQHCLLKYILALHVKTL